MQVATNTASSPSTLRALKICGLVSAQDARLAATIARSVLPPHVDLLLGTIVWPHSKRSVIPAVARAIANTARDFSATPVAVFVDESTDEIEAFCERYGFDVAQLHGKKSRNSLRRKGGSFGTAVRWIDVRDVKVDGKVVEEMEMGSPSWRLFDAKGGGTGVAFDWGAFERPMGEWLLAGGLHEHNVGNAIKLLAPHGVDVASGVAGEDRCRKDEAKLGRFVETVVEAYGL